LFEHLKNEFLVQKLMLICDFYEDIKMSSVCFYFQVHQPRRMYEGHVMNVGGTNTPEKLDKAVFDDATNKRIFYKVLNKCYLPTNNLMLEKIDQLKSENKKFKISYSMPGVFMEQMEKWSPDLLETFRQMNQSKCVEFMNETYMHSLCSFWGNKTYRPEFKEQVELNHQMIKDLIGYNPKVFRNTELLYNTEIAQTVEKLGYKGIFAEGLERVLGWRSPEHLYTAPDSNIRLFFRHYKLSDDMSYRFSARWFPEWPVTAEKFSNWVGACQGEVINLCMDYETFGEHLWEDTGIFWFLKALPEQILKWDHVDFVTPSEAIERYPIRDTVHVDPYSTISWADMERDPSAWLGNNMQRLAFSELERVGKIVKKADDPKLIKTWRYMQTSDHLYYMCTKSWSDGDVHKYFSPYGTPQEAFEGVIKAISQLEYIARKILKQKNIE
jgi:alpha-amylase